MSTPRPVIVGAATSDYGRVDDKNIYELHYQASRRALADAGLSKDRVDGFMSTGAGQLAPIEIAEYLGLNPTTYVDSTGVGGSTWEVFLEHAVAAIRTGQANTILITYGSTTRQDLKNRRRTANIGTAGGARGPAQFEAPYGPSLISKYAMAAMRHMHEFGTTVDQLANIAVDTRYNASLNPQAQYQQPIDLDTVHNDRMIAEPFTKMHCCIRSDGGGSIVVTRDDIAADLPATPIHVLGTGTAVSHTAMNAWPDYTESPALHSGRHAFGQAGLTPDDVDICQFYDSFTITVLETFEALGFCGRGEGGPFLEGGTMRVDGKLPTNTDGGGLSSCHPGMRGIFLLVEAVRQLRHEAGQRQVPGEPRIACVNGTGGWFSSTSTALLGTADAAG